MQIADQATKYGFETSTFFCNDKSTHILQWQHPFLLFTKHNILEYKPVPNFSLRSLVYKNSFLTNT